MLMKLLYGHLKVKKSKFTFNYDSMKSLNEDVQMRSDWLFPFAQVMRGLKIMERSFIQLKNLKVYCLE